MKLDLERGGWVHLDVRKLMHGWFKSPEENLGLVVNAFDGDGRPLGISKPTDEDMSSVSCDSKIIKIINNSF